MRQGRFEIQVMDDPEHEDLIAEVLLDGEFCLLVSQEDGFMNLAVKIIPRADGQPWELRQADLQQVLKDVSDQLWRLRRIV